LLPDRGAGYWLQSEELKGACLKWRDIDRHTAVFRDSIEALVGD